VGHGGILASGLSWRGSLWKAEAWGSHPSGAWMGQPFEWQCRKGQYHDGTHCRMQSFGI
jgi:hypothetical protein